MSGGLAHGGTCRVLLCLQCLPTSDPHIVTQL